MSLALSSLLGLLGGPAVPQSLGKILEVVFGSGGSVRTAVEKELEKRLDAQEGRSGGELLSRGVLKQIDEAMEAKPPGATVDQQIQVGTMLAKGAAVQLAEAAEILLKYPDLQAEVVHAKAANDNTRLTAARAARD